MPDIQQLSPSVVNKIAAGEVIERPASVVKELMENSVDAGATRIDVRIEKGGTESIRVADNGSGIAPDQLRLAVASHATSKIRTADDLFDVRTLGFRGEALASIAEVSQFRMRSRPRDEQGGAELDVHGGQIGDVAPCGAPVGTSIEVRQLFFNTPVRRKFLRTTQTEMGHITEAFTRIALPHPRVHFTLEHNGRVLYELPPADRWRERIATFFGPEIAQSLISVSSDDGEVRLSGYVAEPTQSRANNRMQYVFLNGRHIRDRALQHALSEAYRGLLLTGRYPIGFLRLEIPADQVDVNVHPTKLEVRFQDGGRVYSRLLSTLRQKFLSTDLTAHVRPPSEDTSPATGGHDQEHAERHRDEMLRWAKGQLETGTGTDDASGGTGGTSPERTTDRGSTSAGSSQRRWMWEDAGGRDTPAPFRPFPNDFGRMPAADARQTGDPAGRGSSQAADGESTGSLAVSRANVERSGGIQVHNRYLITENETGVVIIDQHALHERIVYEQLREKVLSGTLERQRLLVPEPVSLTPSETAIAMESREVLQQLGIDIEPFGGDTILVSSYPAMLANFDPQEVLRQIIDQLMSGGKQPERRDLLDEMLHMISCKAAIKAGDRLSPDEVTALLDQRHLYQDTHHCPHGRPTALVFSREELDRRFKRT